MHAEKYITLHETYSWIILVIPGIGFNLNNRHALKNIYRILVHSTICILLFWMWEFPPMPQPICLCPQHVIISLHVVLKQKHAFLSNRFSSTLLALCSNSDLRANFFCHTFHPPPCMFKATILPTYKHVFFSIAVGLSAQSLRGGAFDFAQPKLNSSLPFLLNWLPVSVPRDREFCQTDDDCHKFDPASYCENGPGKQPVDVWNW